MKLKPFYTLALLACMAVGSVQGMAWEKVDPVLQFGWDLQDLVKKNDLTGVQKLCKQNPTMIVQVAENNSNYLYTSLSDAIEHNHLEMVKFLVSTYGPYIELHHECYDAALKGIDPEIFACIVQQLKTQYPENWQQKLGCGMIRRYKPLDHNAIERSINAGADINTHFWSYGPYDPANVSYTLLHELVELALTQSLKDNDVEISTIKLLLANGARTDIKNSQGKTVRDLCQAQGKHIDTLNALRDLIIGPTQETIYVGDATNLPLVLAKIIAEYAFLDDQELLAACKDCAKDPMARRVEHLLASGHNPNITNSNGKGTLAYAAECGNACAIQYLLTHKANTLILLPEIPHFYIPLCDEHGTTPLHHAAEQGSPEVVELLINKTPAEYRKALVNAATTYTTVNPTNSRFRVHDPLKAAKRYRDGKNIEEVAGTTPLMGAAGFGHPDVVKLLLQHGADKNMRDKHRDKHMPHGRTALDCAKISAITGDAQEQCIALLSA